MHAGRGRGLVEIEGINTNRFAITDFALDTSNRLVGFSLKWDEDLFSSLDSRHVDLFMSTNLSVRNWFWLNDFYLPSATNEHTLIVDKYDVTYDMRNVFTNAFNTQAFFAFGLGIDSDGDNLTDAFEKFVIGSSPLVADTDGDYYEWCERFENHNRH